VGRQLSGTDQEGRTLVLTVRELADETVKLDANHPLAGQELTFDLEVVGVVCPAPRRDGDGPRAISVP
jgi:peptidylprolyl isomerase